MSVVVDAEVLILALEDHSPETEWFLDVATGEIISLRNPLITGDSSLQESFASKPERYLRIQPLPSRDLLLVMEYFVSTLPPGTEASELSRALQPRHPFRSFKSTLEGFPFTRERWLRFHEAQMRSVAEQWLRDNAVRAVLSPRPKRGRKA